MWPFKNRKEKKKVHYTVTKRLSSDGTPYYTATAVVYGTTYNLMEHKVGEEKRGYVLRTDCMRYVTSYSKEGFPYFATPLVARFGTVGTARAAICKARRKKVREIEERMEREKRANYREVVEQGECKC